MTIAIIPARGGSKGIPNKNIQEVGGLSLIARTINAALNCSDISDVYVSTDSNEISLISESVGAKIVFRPSDLASDTASSETALIHTISSIPNFQILSPKFIFMQCTSPFVKSSDISSVIHGLDENHNSSFSATEWHGFLWDEYGNGINHDFNKKRKRRQDLSIQLLETGAIYCMNTELFMSQKTRFIEPVNPINLKNSFSPEIDTEKDLEICRLLAPYFDHK
jgi:CMP-N-acetylneuraminic acid synthetase